MANKRNLKKALNNVCGELFAECIAAASVSKHEDAEVNLEALLKSVLHMHSDYIMRVSHPEPGMKAKKYYQALIVSFNKDINDTVDRIGNMLC